MNNPTQSEIEKENERQREIKYREKRKEIEQQIHQDNLDKGKPDWELTEKEILLKILYKLTSIEKIVGRTEELSQLQRISLDNINTAVRADYEIKSY